MGLIASLPSSNAVDKHASQQAGLVSLLSAPTPQFDGVGYLSCNKPEAVAP